MKRIWYGIMKNLLRIIVLVSLGASAHFGNAQVYESKDADGQPVFSDTPTEGATPVEVKPTNQAESVRVERPPETPPETAKGSAAPEPGTVEYQQELDREMEAYEREQDRLERHGEKRIEVGHDNLQRHEVGDENLQRHEVDDDIDMRRHEVGAGNEDT